MTQVRLSRRAQADLQSISRHTAKNWGRQQGLAYIDSLEDCCQLLSQHPALGKDASMVATGLRMHRHQSLIVPYQIHDGGILVARILHERMDVMRQYLESNDER